MSTRARCALVDGTVRVDGVDATFESARIVSDIFERMIRQRAFDVSELGLTFYLRTLDLDDPPFIAIPVFPARHFRHSAVFVNTSSGIDKPQDLAGKTIGEFAMYGTDAGVWPKGILSDDYGVHRISASGSSAELIGLCRHSISFPSCILRTST